MPEQLDNSLLTDRCKQYSIDDMSSTESANAVTRPFAVCGYSARDIHQGEAETKILYTLSLDVQARGVLRTAYRDAIATGIEPAQARDLIVVGLDIAGAPFEEHPTTYNRYRDVGA